MPSEKIEEIVKDWNKYASNLEEAIFQRNYFLFKTSFQKGSRCFSQIKICIENSKEDIFPFREQIMEITKRWLTSAEALPIWMAEIKKKAEASRKTKFNDKKIYNAYRFMKKTGNQLKVKAK